MLKHLHCFVWLLMASLLLTGPSEATDPRNPPSSRTKGKSKINLTGDIRFAGRFVGGPTINKNGARNSICSSRSKLLGTWGKRDLTYRVNLPSSSPRNMRKVARAIEDAIKIWEKTGLLSLNQASPGTPSDITISVVTTSHLDGRSFRRREFGHAFAPPSCGDILPGHIHMSYNQNWCMGLN